MIINIRLFFRQFTAILPTKILNFPATLSVINVVLKPKMEEKNISIEILLAYFFKEVEEKLVL